MILFYISGHGFGHVSREEPVMQAVKNLNADIGLAVRTPAIRWFVKEAVPEETIIEEVRIDVGVVQKDSMRMDVKATLEDYAKLIENKEEIIRKEADWCRQHKVKVIVGDIPPLAFDIAEAAGIPSICIANFSWDWIYEEYLDEFPVYSFVVEDIRKSESKCGLCLTTPFSEGLEAFPARKEIGLICRKSQYNKSEARKKAGLPEDKRLALFSFGGFGLEAGSDLKSELPEDMVLVVTQPDYEQEGSIYFSREDFCKRGLKYYDLVRAVDVVITKPGYGIVSECIANETPMMFIEREYFREYAVFERELMYYLRCGKIPTELFYQGWWKEHLQRLFTSNCTVKEINLKGAEEAAGEIMKMC